MIAFTLLSPVIKAQFSKEELRKILYMDADNKALRRDSILSDSVIKVQHSTIVKQDSIIINDTKVKNLQADYITKLEGSLNKEKQRVKLFKRLVPIGFVLGVGTTLFAIRYPFFP